jgi:thioredoxin reductase
VQLESDLLKETKLSQWFVHHPTVLEYIQKFATDQDLVSLVEFGTAVVSIQKKGKLWIVTTTKLKDDLTEEYSLAEFDAIVIGTGHYDLEYIPPIPGVQEWLSAWPERISHSKSYRTSDKYASQNILVIGSGTSAFEIAKDVAWDAKNVWLAKRTTAGKGSSVEDAVDDVVSSLYPPNLEVTSEVVEFDRASIDKSVPAKVAVRLKDGASLKDIDHILFCTGYRYTLPFIQSDTHPDLKAFPILSVPSAHVSLPYRSSTSLSQLGYSPQLQSLHLDIFYIPDPTLVFIGLPIKVQAIPFFEVQVLAMAAVLSGKANLPNKETMIREYEEKLKIQGPGKPFHVLGRAKEAAYVHNILSWMKTEGLETEGYDFTIIMKALDRVEVVRQFLLARTRIRGMSDQEIEALVDEKIKILKSRLEAVEA